MNKTVVGCLIAAALAVILPVLAIGIWLVREAPMLDASLSVPPQVALDSTAIMVVTTTNPHPKPVTLDSIDVDDSFLAGFQVVRIDPEPVDTMHIFGQRSWTFDQSVAPGDSLEVRFELRAVQEGHFSGDVDVCNPGFDFMTVVADVVVTEEADVRGEAIEATSP